MKWAITVDDHTTYEDCLLAAIVFIRKTYGILELGTIVTLERIE